jgi:hypothetical protein
MIRVPRKESQTIHPTQQLSGSALRTSRISSSQAKDIQDFVDIHGLFVQKNFKLIVDDRFCVKQTGVDSAPRMARQRTTCEYDCESEGSERTSEGTFR